MNSIAPRQIQGTNYACSKAFGVRVTLHNEALADCTWEGRSTDGA